ncbi:amino acid permease [candidate division CSSED10-310 bacterium]|uniref:Amino acid permease n=1 Tax=candidate division CSSED10-310 bacterium TaxID=2855610 RepID=A0ABV6YU53_UNCC1
MNQNSSSERTIGLLGATGVGIGAIVGGGILALAGVAFATTGPSAIISFSLNGLIALLTALTFAELSVAFPESGGTYVFAKKVLTVQAAFTVGWVVWFASIVAAVLYSLGFAAFSVVVIENIWRALQGTVPFWLTSHGSVTTLAIAANIVYGVSLIRTKSGGGQWENVGKIVIFVILIAGGLWALSSRSWSDIQTNLRPFFSSGMSGLIKAMGYTFIALQGFDLIAAVAGEIRNPERNIPRAMFLSLGTAVAIYIPLLFIVATVGVDPGQSITSASAAQPETIIAVAAQNYLGQFGYWLVMVAAIFSMLSALRANLFAASRVALTMSRDRTLPYTLDAIDVRSGTPKKSILVTLITVTLILSVTPDIAAAGAASSLIFLITFALAHWIGILARLRGSAQSTAFRVPLFPFFPVLGAISCLGLAVFQGISVPSAGLIAGGWLLFGGILYLVLFARRARVVDALSEAHDPQLVRLRGRSPLVLVPIANPASARAMVAVANALAPPSIGRVLLLLVVTAPKIWQPGEIPEQLLDAQDVLCQSLLTSFTKGLSPEALTTIAEEPWPEISRVARTYRCESLLLGFSKFSDTIMGGKLETLMSKVDCDVVILRAPTEWRLSDVTRVLVPMGGRGGQDELRARLLGSLCRTSTQNLEITFLLIMPEHLPAHEYSKAERELSHLAHDEVPGKYTVKVAQSNNVTEEIIRAAENCDLLILGLQRLRRHQKVFGDVTLRIVHGTTCAIIMISRRG